MPLPRDYIKSDNYLDTHRWCGNVGEAEGSRAGVPCRGASLLGTVELRYEVGAWADCMPFFKKSPDSSSGSPVTTSRTALLASPMEMVTCS